MALPVFRSSTVVASANGTACVPTKPAGVVDGDLLIACISYNSSSGSINSVPAGWATVAAGVATNGTNLTAMTIYAKIAAGEGASWSWGLSATMTSIAVCVAYSGADKQIMVSGLTASSAAGTNLIAPTITPYAPCILGTIYASRSGANAITLPGGQTSRAETHAAATGGRSIRFGDETYNSTAATGTRTATTTETESWVAANLMIASPLSGTPLFFGSL